MRTTCSVCLILWQQVRVACQCESYAVCSSDGCMDVPSAEPKSLGLVLIGIRTVTASAGGKGVSVQHRKGLTYCVCSRAVAKRGCRFSFCRFSV